jgi:hypothetical protein
MTTFDEFEVSFRVVVPTTDRETEDTIRELLTWFSREYDLNADGITVTRRALSEENH